MVNQIPLGLPTMNLEDFQEDSAEPSKSSDIEELKTAEQRQIETMKNMAQENTLREVRN